MRIKSIIVSVLMLQFLAVTSACAAPEKGMAEMMKEKPPLSLITKTPEEGF